MKGLSISQVPYQRRGAKRNIVGIKPTQPQDKKTAIEEHTKFQRRFNSVIDESSQLISTTSKFNPLERRVLARNSAQLIKTGKLPVTIFSPTHDTYVRAQILGEPKKKAFFDIRASFPAIGGTYSDDKKEKDGIEISDETTLGGTVPIESGSGVQKKHLTFYRHDDADCKKNAIKRTIIHECQHATDLTFPGELMARKQRGKTSQEKEFSEDIDHALSEFTSYFLEDEDNSLSIRGSSKKPATNHSFRIPGEISGLSRTYTVRPGMPITSIDKKSLSVGAPGFKNQRQEEIIHHITQMYPNVGKRYLKDPIFRKHFHRETIQLQGFNLINSPRIHQIAEYLDEFKRQGTRFTKSNVGKIKRLFIALDKYDKRFLKSTKANPFWVQISNILGTALTSELKQYGILIK